jgi:tRNA (guanine6-N2)-methyltransferase
MPDYFATTTPGLEDVSCAEVTELLGVDSARHKPGMIAFSADLDAVFLLNYTARSLHRIYLALTQGPLAELADTGALTRALRLGGFIDPTQSFGVRPERHGVHDFTSLDVGREVGQAVIDTYQAETGARLRVDLDRPDVIIRAEVRDAHCWVGIDTTGDMSLHHRGYREYGHPAPLRPTIAYALLRLAGWTPDQSLLDPFCGSGTIPIEAALWAGRIPNWFRDDYAFHRLAFLDHARFAELKAEIDAKARVPDVRAFGCEVARNHVRGAAQTAERAGVNVDFFRGDATEIPLWYDCLVTNPPYGLRIATKRITANLYRNFAANLERWEWRRAIMLTGSPQYFESSYLVSRRNIMYGDLPAAVLTLEKA